MDFPLLILEQEYKYKRCSEIKIETNWFVPVRILLNDSKEIKTQKLYKFGFILRYQYFSGTTGAI